MPFKQIVTGVAGFIGSTLAERLLADGHSVVGVDCITDYYSVAIKRENLKPLLAHKNFSYHEANIADLDWAPILKGARTVFHQAAQAGVRASWGQSFGIYTELNVRATQVLLEAMKETDARMVYASSSSVYGDSPHLPMNEDDRPRPMSPYGVTKLAAEHLCCLYTKAFGVRTTSLRYFTVFGPRQRPDMAFHKFIKATIQGQEITLYGDGEQTRDFTYVDDIVEANLLAAEKGRPGEIYNIGGGRRMTVNEVISMLEKILDRPVKVRRLGNQTGDMRHTFADTARAQVDLGFVPKFSVEQGLRLEAKWIENRLPLLV